MGTELSGLEERIANTHAGAITSIQAVYVPADDLTDPAAVHVFSHLSASIVLSRKRASEGLYPAIDLLQSSSKMATPGIVGDRHYNLAQEIRRTLAQYESLKDIVAMLGMEQLSIADRNAVGRARRLERFLTQPFFTTEQFSGMKGKLVSLSDALDGCERILRDEFKDYPERALYDRRDWRSKEAECNSLRGEGTERGQSERPEGRCTNEVGDCEWPWILESCSHLASSWRSTTWRALLPTQPMDPAVYYPSGWTVLPHLFQVF